MANLQEMYRQVGPYVPQPPRPIPVPTTPPPYGTGMYNPNSLKAPIAAPPGGIGAVKEDGPATLSPFQQRFPILGGLVDAGRERLGQANPQRMQALGSMLRNAGAGQLAASAQGLGRSGGLAGLAAGANQGLESYLASQPGPAEPPEHIEVQQPDGTTQYMGWDGVGYNTPLGQSPQTGPLVQFGAESPAWIDEWWTGSIENLGELRAGAEAAPRNITNALDAYGLVNDGILNGTFANVEQLLFGIASEFNILGDSEQERLDNTREFIANRGRAVGQIIKLFGSGTGLSDADREYALQIAGGQITMTEEAIRNILRMEVVANYNLANNYNIQAGAMRDAAGDAPTPPISDVVMPEYVEERIPEVLQQFDAQREQYLIDAFGLDEYRRLDATAGQEGGDVVEFDATAYELRALPPEAQRGAGFHTGNGGTLWTPDNGANWYRVQ